MTLPTTYRYEVSDVYGYNIGQLTSVVNDFSYTQEINQPAVTLTIELQLPVGRDKELVDPLLDESGNIITNESGEPIYIDRQPEYFEYLTRVHNRVEVTEFSDYNVNGLTVFDGRITKQDIDSTHNKIIVTLLSNAADYEQIIVTDSGSTEITKGSVAPEDMITENVVNYLLLGGSVGSYNVTATGVISSYTFSFMTMLEIVQASFSLCPSDYYWYVDCGTSEFFLAPAATTADHKFTKGVHFTNLVLTEDLERIKNDVFFTGGDTGSGVNLFKHYYNQTSIDTYGRRGIKLVDNRVTLDATAQTIGTGYLDRYATPNYTSTLTIASSTYNISSINVGDVVGFQGNGNLFDDLLLQIVRKTRSSKYVTLELGLLPYKSSATYEEIRRQLASTQTLANPSAPS